MEVLGLLAFNKILSHLMAWCTSQGSSNETDIHYLLCTLLLVTLLSKRDPLTVYLYGLRISTISWTVCKAFNTGFQRVQKEVLDCLPLDKPSISELLQ